MWGRRRLCVTELTLTRIHTFFFSLFIFIPPSPTVIMALTENLLYSRHHFFPIILLSFLLKRKESKEKYTWWPIELSNIILFFFIFPNSYFFFSKPFKLWSFKWFVGGHTRWLKNAMNLAEGGY